MRIDTLAAQAVTSVGAETGTAAKSAAGNGGTHQSAMPMDTASLSSIVSPVPALTSQALASSEARAAKVEALRIAVTSAEYTVDPALIADAMISMGA